MGIFFYISCQIDEIEIKELLLRRYGRLDFLNEFGLKEFCDFIILAIKKEREERIERQWLAMLPKMYEFIPYERFREIMTGENIDWRPVEDIIAEIDAKHEGMKNGT